MGLIGRLKAKLAEGQSREVSLWALVPYVAAVALWTVPPIEGDAGFWLVLAKLGAAGLFFTFPPTVERISKPRGG